jgi:transcription-repair coupling factor (superfamily II helicase)
LLIIDEEQRFGVKHKERLKELRENVDVLSVTATPIPRTTYMSMTGSKDISVIETPPKFRKPVSTTVSKYNQELLIKAVETEMSRKGQLFFIHNSVDTISKKVSELKTLFPSLRFQMLHAQMDEKKIKSIMTSFINYEFDILVSTTIIENGIDIKNANTIIIDSSERFGLSQIHQLRGRVGRSDIQSYAYLFYSVQKTLSDKATQRLQAIKEYVSLGSGYHLALRDLEIRGAGNILGQQQFGHVLKVGFSYYCKLLEESMYRKKRKRNKSTFWMPLRTDKIRLPSDFISNQRERIAIYRRFMMCQSVEDLDRLKTELQDRYGRFNAVVNDVFDYVMNEIISNS